MLLKPFNVGISGQPDDEAVDCEEDGVPELVDVSDDEEDDENAHGADECEDENGPKDDNIDELDALTSEEREELLASTATVRAMVTKVCLLLHEVLFVTDYITRFASSRLQLFGRPQSLFQHGARHVLNVSSSPDLFPAMS